MGKTGLTAEGQDDVGFRLDGEGGGGADHAEHRVDWGEAWCLHGEPWCGVGPACQY